MKCVKCPLFQEWNNESNSDKTCVIFGDRWDSRFQYENEEGTIVGCYLDRHYIEKVDVEIDKYYARMAQHFMGKRF